ncbi:hypothetical protein [Phenylobacterium sp.]|uniref:alginate O-acetyltransferase AlgX-related protein n=1 Tax=Phenylobacterium sp. TaxID=1871053 RepID=UPI00301E1CD0
MDIGHPAHWRRLATATALALAGVVALPWVLPEPVLQENRHLAPAPPLPRSLGGLEAYRKAADAYVADNFPGRAHLIAGLNRLRLFAGVSGTPRVVVGREGWLFSDNETRLSAARGQPPMSPDETAAWLEGLAGRTETLAGGGAAYVVLVAPVKEAVHDDRAPWWFRLEPRRAAVILPALAAESEAGQVVYPASDLARHARWGLKTYSAHDSHWTGLGAYLGYAALMDALHARGLADAPRPLESFRDAARQPRNTPRDLAMMLGVAGMVRADYPEFDDPAAPPVETVYLTDVRDWTGPHVIETGQAGKPVLLMTVDSFSNALMPFLYGHFSRIVVSHAQDGAWRPDLVARFKPDIVVSEIIEMGLPAIMARSPVASAGARRRIVEAVTEHERHIALAAARAVRPAPPMVRRGGDGPDHIVGGPGDDHLHGGPGDDEITGLGGNDVLVGGRGRDRVDGGDGADFISGGRDDDVLIGGRGADVFHSFAGAGTDEVLDFSIAEGDRIELEAGTAYTVRQVGADTIVEMDGARLILRNVIAADLPPGRIRVR